MGNILPFQVDRISPVEHEGISMPQPKSKDKVKPAAVWLIMIIPLLRLFLQQKLKHST